MAGREDPERRIPRTMSTQHPDNASRPEWCEGDVIDGEAEVYEAYFAYRALGCQEVMWDSEGKDVDTHVVRKLLSKHGDYFKEHVLGRDVFLTYRIPNPSVEAVEKKVVVETLQNIPVAHDVASAFYREDVSPIFEVILPFTTEARQLIRLRNYYQTLVAAEEARLDGLATVKDWLGAFQPKGVEVIPLVEDFGSLVAIDRLVQPYLEAFRPRRLRVFIARSDPALNYGLFCAVALANLSLSKLKSLERRLGVPLHPILGVGSNPFRGHLSPENLEGFLGEYRGLATVTVQSALKYDYPPEQVGETVRRLNARLPNGEPGSLEPEEEGILLSALGRFRARYERTVEGLAPLVNSVAAHVPRRRARKLHIGLFGYSRSVAGAVLPRAIPFASALYSLGLPPEFLGGKVLSELKEREWRVFRRFYVNLKEDLQAAGCYVSWPNLHLLRDLLPRAASRADMEAARLEAALARILEDLRAVEECLGVKLGPRSLSQRKHENFTNNFLISYLEGEEGQAQAALFEAARLRRGLG